MREHESARECEQKRERELGPKYQRHKTQDFSKLGDGFQSFPLLKYLVIEVKVIGFIE